MRYKIRNVAALQLALGDLPDATPVEADQNLAVSAKTVGELRGVTTWPENLVVITPLQGLPESTLKITKASGSKRVTPKP